MNYKMVFSYFGELFFGYQVQKEKRTVQEEIEKVLSKLFQEKIVIHSSGRTDKGVHAINQVATFHANNEFNINKLKYVLNRLLPEDIHIKSISYCDADFHARFSSIGKKYVYRMFEGDNNPLLNKHVYFYKGPKLNFDKMNQTKDLFIGKHNFINFCSNDEKDICVETINSIEIVCENGFYTFTLIGSGFKRYMVRFIVGTIIAVARNKITIEEVKERINCDVIKTVPFKVPAHGLYLERVYYEGDELK